MVSSSGGTSSLLSDSVSSHMQILSVLSSCSRLHRTLLESSSSLSDGVDVTRWLADEMSMTCWTCTGSEWRDSASLSRKLWQDGCGYVLITSTDDCTDEFLDMLVGGCITAVGRGACWSGIARSSLIHRHGRRDRAGSTSRSRHAVSIDDGKLPHLVGWCRTIMRDCGACSCACTSECRLILLNDIMGASCTLLQTFTSPGGFASDMATLCLPLIAIELSLGEHNGVVSSVFSSSTATSSLL